MTFRHPSRHATVLLALSLTLVGAVPAQARQAAGPSRVPRMERAPLQYRAVGGTAGRNRFVLRQHGTLVELLDAATQRVLRAKPISQTSAIIISGADGKIDNTLIVDFSGGMLAVPGGIQYDGGKGGYNTLALTGGHPQVEHLRHTGPHSGSIQLDHTMIRFSDIAPIADTTPAITYTFNVFANSQINIVDGPVVLGYATTEISSPSSAFETTDIANKVNVTINGNPTSTPGGDDFVLNNPVPATGLTSLALVGGQNADTFTVTSTPAAVPVTLRSGPNATSIDVLGTAVGGTLAVTSVNAMHVTVGNAGSVQGINAAVTVNNPPSFTSLTVDDSADTIARAVSIGSSGGNTTISGLAPATIQGHDNDLNSLTVDGGSGGNTFTIASTSGEYSVQLNTGTGNDSTVVQTTTGSESLIIHGQSGQDTLTVGNAGNAQMIQGRVSIDNAVGSTAVTLDDSADATGRTVSIGGGQVTGLAPSTISYANVSTLTADGGSGADAFTVTPDTTTAYVVNGNAPTTTPGDTLQLNAAGFTPLIFTPNGVGAGTFTFSNGGKPVSFTGIESLFPPFGCTVNGAVLQPGVGSLQFSRLAVGNSYSGQVAGVLGGLLTLQHPLLTACSAAGPMHTATVVGTASGQSTLFPPGTGLTLSLQTNADGSAVVTVTGSNTRTATLHGAPTSSPSRLTIGAF